MFLCLDSDTAGSEACTRLAQSIPGEIAVIRLVPARKDWNDVLRQQGDIPSRKFIAETITLRELPTAQPVPMLRMADVELTSVDWLWFPYIPFGKLTIIQGNPGEGKTYFAMRLAAACTNRKPLPGMETLEPFNIIYQTAEDGLGDTVKPRLMEADADLEAWQRRQGFYRYLNIAALPCSLIPTPPDDEPSPDIFHLQEDFE